MSGNKGKSGCEFSVSQRDSCISRGCDGRSYAGHNFKRDFIPDKYLCFFSTPTEYKGVASLKPGNR